MIQIIIGAVVVAALYAGYRAYKARKASSPLPAPQPGAVTPAPTKYPPSGEKP